MKTQYTEEDKYIRAKKKVDNIICSDNKFKSHC